MKSMSPRVAAFEAALSEARKRLAAGDTAGAMQALERAHVLGQTDLGPHLRAHLAMLRVAFTARDWREVCGQVMRIALVPMGHLFGRLPRGNTGRSNVSAFTAMPIPPELERLLDDTKR
jgi:hypothetical protein